MADADDYLAAYRRQASGDGDAQANNLAALRRRVAAGEIVDDAPAPRLASAWSRRAAAFFAFSKPGLVSLVVATAAVGTVKVGAVAYHSLEQPAAVVAPTRPEADGVAPATSSTDRGHRPPRDESTVGPSPATPSADAGAPVERTDAPVERTDASPTSSAAASSAIDRVLPRTPRSAEAPRPSAPVEDALAKELALLERTQAKLDAGQYAAVLELVAQLDREHPSGALLEERRAWRAIAACELHRADAPALATIFYTQHERSPLVAKVRHSCSKESDGSTSPAG